MTQSFCSACGSQLGYRAAQAGIKTRFMTAADLLLVLTTAYLQNNLKSVMNRTIKA